LSATAYDFDRLQAELRRLRTDQERAVTQFEGYRAAALAREASNRHRLLSLAGEVTELRNALQDEKYEVEVCRKELDETIARLQEAVRLRQMAETQLHAVLESTVWALTRGPRAVVTGLRSLRSATVRLMRDSWKGHDH
jgi:chromosome segregation ATPase